MVKKQLVDLAGLEKANTIRLKEYCYTDTAPTFWKREAITQCDIDRGLIPYHCESCDARALYTLKTPPEKK